MTEYDEWEPQWEEGDDDECEHLNVDPQAAESAPMGWGGHIDIYDVCLDCNAVKVSGHSSVL